MPDVTEQPAQPTDRRGRRIYVYWAVALTLLALLGVFCWAVVAPVWQVRRAVMDCVPPPANGGAAFSFDETKAKRHIERLGGQGAAAQRLARYLGLPRCLAPHRDIAVRMMRPCGDAATPYLISCLTDNDRRVRVAAALVLGWNPDSRATEALVTTLVTDQSAYVRELAAGALGEIRDQSAIRPLADALSDGDKNVRREAARALAMLGDYRGIDVLVTALRDTDKIYRLRVITALEYHFGSRAIPPLSLILADEDKDVRQAAAEALKKIRGEEASAKTLSEDRAALDKYLATSIGWIDGGGLYRGAPDAKDQACARTLEPTVLQDVIAYFRAVNEGHKERFSLMVTIVAARPVHGFLLLDLAFDAPTGEHLVDGNWHLIYSPSQRKVVGRFVWYPQG